MLLDSCFFVTLQLVLRLLLSLCIACLHTTEAHAGNWRVLS
jgi:hypothetical protein